MNNITYFTGIIGSLVLLIGYAWPELIGKHPVKSIKNWLFSLGGLLMFTYALLGYIEGSSILYVILESLIVIASILMMLNLRDIINTFIILFFGILLITLSISLFEDYSTMVFIFGLIGISLGYTFKAGTLRRSLALTMGSILIAVFSYIEANWIFFVLNSFFSLFSFYYLLKYKKIFLITKRSRKKENKKHLK